MLLKMRKLLLLIIVALGCRSSGYNLEIHSVLPDPEGFAGSMGAMFNEEILLIGGSNFPNGKRPWDGGVKVWYNHIYAYQNGKWNIIGTLPEPIGYAAHDQWNSYLVYAGGSNENGHSKKAFLLQYESGEAHVAALPDLPETLANAVGKVVHDTFYVIGGLVHPDSMGTSNKVYSLDLNEHKASWQEKAILPQKLMLANIAADEDHIYVLSGTDVMDDGKRKYLNNCWKYVIHEDQWKALASIPVPAVAGLAIYQDQRILVVGGDSGELAGVAPLKEKHPGFNGFVQILDLGTLQWSQSPIQFSNSVKGIPVTTSLVRNDEKYLILGGEVKPGIRTPQILELTL